MAKGANKQSLVFPIRQIPHTRLYDDGALTTRYETLDKLGEGSFGTVFRVQNRENQLFYAMKTITKKPGNKSKASSLDNEVKLLKEVGHPNLIRLEEVLESSQTLYLIVELCEGGELGVYVKKNGPLPEETVKQIMSKLVNALYYLHKMDIVHRDLKLENILLKNTPTSKTDDFDIRVTDFGLSSKKSITNTDSLFNEFCGTPLYMAPEILDNKNYSALCDVWAMGIIMYYLICGRHPYVANDERRLLEMIRAQKVRYDSEKFRELSADGLDFLKGMLVYDTVHRRTMGELTVHPWLTGESGKGPAKDIITMMKEFQAENERRRTSLNTDADIDVHPPRISSASSPSKPHDDKDETLSLGRPTPIPLNQIRANINTPERRSTFDRNRLHVKVNRLTSDSQKTPKRSTNESNLASPSRQKPNSTISELVDSAQTRLALNSPSVPPSSKLRPTTNLAFGRSQSQADLVYSSKILQQQQRTTSNNSLGIGASPCSVPSSSGVTTPTLSKISTPTALLMFNKQQSNNSSSSLPTISHHSTKIDLYDKRHSNHT